MADNSKLSDATLAVLKSAGWMPTRRVEIPEDRISVINRISVANPHGIRFLEEFFPLHLIVANQRLPNVPGHVNIDPLIGSYSGMIPKDNLYKILGETACIVGCFSVMTLFVTSSNRFGFSDVDQTVCGILGLGKTEALNRLCDGRFGKSSYWTLDEDWNPTSFVDDSSNNVVSL